MSAYLAGLWSAVTALLPVLLAIAVLILIALVLDARSAGKW